MEQSSDNDFMRSFLEQSCKKTSSSHIPQMIASALDFFIEDLIARTSAEESEIGPNDVLNVIKSMPEYQFAQGVINDHPSD
jgi:hypothetical protein